MILVNNRRIPFPETERLFDRHLMNIFLEQYETNFDEITEIVIKNYVGKEIVDLPEKLEKLEINHTNLESLILPIHSRFIMFPHSKKSIFLQRFYEEKKKKN
jgi:hypothetical protein